MAAGLWFLAGVTQESPPAALVTLFLMEVGANLWRKVRPCFVYPGKLTRNEAFFGGGGCGGVEGALEAENSI